MTFFLCLSRFSCLVSSSSCRSSSPSSASPSCSPSASPSPAACPDDEGAACVLVCPSASVVAFSAASSSPSRVRRDCPAVAQLDPGADAPRPRPLPLVPRGLVPRPRPLPLARMLASLAGPLGGGELGPAGGGELAGLPSPDFLPPLPPLDPGPPRLPRPRPLVSEAAPPLDAGALPLPRPRAEPAPDAEEAPGDMARA